MKQPTLFLMLGYPGAGKTHTSKIMAKLTGAVHVSSDIERTKMFDNPTFSQEEHDELYAKLNKKTEQLLRSGQSVIYDANLNRHRHRQEKYDICQQTAAKPVLIWVRTPRDLAKQRAMHESRAHLWPQQETADAMFERIAEVIEVPSADENPLEIIGQDLDKPKIESFLKKHHLI